MQPIITTSNSYQSIARAKMMQVNVVGNLSIENPTLAQMNDAILAGSSIRTDRERSEPLFGQHIREAAGAVRRLFRG